MSSIYAYILASNFEVSRVNNYVIQQGSKISFQQQSFIFFMTVRMAALVFFITIWHNYYTDRNEHTINKKTNNKQKTKKQTIEAGVGIES